MLWLPRRRTGAGLSNNLFQQLRKCDIDFAIRAIIKPPAGHNNQVYRIKLTAMYAEIFADDALNSISVNRCSNIFLCDDKTDSGMAKIVGSTQN